MRLVLGQMLLILLLWVIFRRPACHVYSCSVHHGRWNEKIDYIKVIGMLKWLQNIRKQNSIRFYQHTLFATSLNNAWQTFFLPFGRQNNIASETTKSSKHLNCKIIFFKKRRCRREVTYACTPYSNIVRLVAQILVNFTHESEIANVCNLDWWELLMLFIAP